MIPDPLRATEEDMRSPDWCHSHGCMRGQCPTPEGH